MNSDTDKLKKVASGLNSLKSKVDKLDVDKLKPLLVDLKKKPKWRIRNRSCSKNEYSEFVVKVKVIYTSKLVNRL